MATDCGFHAHIGEVVGLQSFFVLYGPGGRVSAVCSAGITIQREVRESSDVAPVLQIKHTPITHHRHWCGCLFYASSHLLVTSLTSSADTAFHFLVIMEDEHTLKYGPVVASFKKTHQTCFFLHLLCCLKIMLHRLWFCHRIKSTGFSRCFPNHQSNSIIQSMKTVGIICLQ